jgi:hypothetical protein
MEMTHTQSKTRLAPDCDQGLSRFAEADRPDFETNQSFFEGRGMGVL